MSVAITAMAEAEDRLLTTGQVADLFQVSDRTIRNWRARGLLTPVRITGRAVYYRESDVRRLIAQSGQGHAQ